MHCQTSVLARFSETLYFFIRKLPVFINRSGMRAIGPRIFGDGIRFFHCFPWAVEALKAASSLKDVATLAERGLLSPVQLNFQFKQGLYKGSDAVQNLHIDVINQPGV